MRQLGLLAAGTVLFWVIVAYPANRIGGQEDLLQSTVAMLVCLVPAAATLIIVRRSMSKLPEQQLLAMFGGMGVRMGFVLGIGYLLYSSVPVLADVGFWIWLVVFYVATLALEIGLVVTARPIREAQSAGSSPLSPKGERE